MDNRDLSERLIRERTGDPAQVLGFKEYTLIGGRSSGVRCIDVRDGAGLEYTVLPDRGMDIGALSWRGMNCSYLSPCGVVAPSYYEERGIGFLRNFSAGFLTTCGLSNAGSPCVDGGEDFGLHGRISNTPAESVSTELDWQEGEAPRARVRGSVREARLFGENLTLERNLLCPCGEGRILLQDRVRNRGFRAAPLMILYHFNLGYPLLDEGARLIASVTDTVGRDEEAEENLADWALFPAPRALFAERVYFHKLKANRGRAGAALINDRIELAIVLRFDARELPNLTQWKMAGQGEYVLGIEPGNCHPRGRAKARERGELPMIEAGAERTFNLEIAMVEGATRIAELEREICA